MCAHVAAWVEAFVYGRLSAVREEFAPLVCLGL